MTFVSLTRLRIRSIRFMPFFAVYAFRSFRQVSRAAGFQAGAVLDDRERTFWTMTAWDTQENMRQFMTSGAHKKAMPHLLNWCNEASVAHWEQEDVVLPPWTEAAKRMREQGRASKVRYPSSGHASLSFSDPRAGSGTTIHPAT
jgi:hypothetical protein